MKESSAQFKTRTSQALLKFGVAIILFSAIVLLITPLTKDDVKLQKLAHDRYVEVDATIIKSKVQTDKMSRHDQANGAPRYSLDIEYEYEVGGQTYKSTRYAYYKGHPSDKTALQSIVKRYPLGAKVKAYHSPENPQEALLDNSSPDTEAMRKTLYYFFIFGLALVISNYRLPRESDRL